MLRNLARSTWDTLKFFLLVAVVVLPIRAFVAQPFIVSGASMVPTYEDREYIVVDELSYYLRGPERGEVVVFRYPNDPSKHFIKRIVGLPGESVRINNGVWLKAPGGDWQKLAEPYLPATTLTGGNNEEVVLGTSDYFVLGDNRAVSLDSRAWGALPHQLITGRAFLRLFPLNRLGLLSTK
jgi:signal peptidase I